jgi:hypothetical protein
MRVPLEAGVAEALLGVSHAFAEAPGLLNQRCDVHCAIW